jgi:formylmethanofuran:tetrahydromethanopterin formyltransferase
VRDTGFLTWDYREGARDDDQWLYLPELKKVKRIASSDKSGAFIGSDFSYADMTRRVVDEWQYTLLKTDEVRGNPCWLIEAVPVDEAVQDRYGYKKSILFIRQDIFMMCRAVHWLDEGNKIKYVDLPDIREIDGIWTALEINAKTTRNGKTLHRTVFRTENVKYGQAIEESMFTTRQLEKGM